MFEGHGERIGIDRRNDPARLAKRIADAVLLAVDKGDASGYRCHDHLHTDCGQVRPGDNRSLVGRDRRCGAVQRRRTERLILQELDMDGGGPLLLSPWRLHRTGPGRINHERGLDRGLHRRWPAEQRDRRLQQQQQRQDCERSRTSQTVFDLTSHSVLPPSVVQFLGVR